jgi:hypothetical protein
LTETETFCYLLLCWDPRMQRRFTW